MATQPVVNLKLPYIHQILNTPDNFNGQLAAGPVCMLMVLAGYGLLTPRLEIYHNQPSPFGFYVSNAYSSPTGFSFVRTQFGPGHHGSYGGAYGACMNQGQPLGNLMAEYATNHGLNAQTHRAVWLAVEAELNYGAPVVLATTLKGVGHVVVVKGYTDDGRLIVHDPYWGQPGAGEIIYSWNDFGLTPFMVTFNEPLTDQNPQSTANGHLLEFDQQNRPNDPKPPTSLN
jgi:hypothetical protein